MKSHRSNRSRSHPGARARLCAELFPERGARRGRGRAGAALSVSARAAAAMGNQQSASHYVHKPSKNVRWKTAGRPATPGKPDIIPILSDDEPNSITLKWTPAAHDGGAPLLGYQVECNRLGAPDWIRTAPPVVLRPELVLTGLEPPYRYQFRVAALNAVGRSDYSDLSDVLTVSSDRLPHEPPLFLQHLEDLTVLENDKTEFRVAFSGTPPPTIAWFKDDYEIFSSRRTAITTSESTSVLVFHQTLPSDEGEIKCTATNRSGHAVTKARLSLEAAPKLRYPRQYEDGLLYEINETVFLKTTIVGKPTPTVEWRHDGQPIVVDDRVEISNTSKFSMLKIHSARRSDRGEYQIHAKNSIGEDTAAFLVTITAPPDPPQRVSVARQVDKSVTLDWEPPEDDGGCRIGNYVVEYYRQGWNVWLKATTSRKTNVTLFDLIEGSEYRFRVKAESPYGMSAPSVESAPVRIPGRPVDMEFLAVESKIINEVLTREDGNAETRVSPAPRRKRAHTAPAEAQPPARQPRRSPARDPSGSSEFMLVLYPDSQKQMEKSEKRQSIQLDLDALTPPPLSFSAPELSSRCMMPFKALRNAVSSSQLLHELAMARVHKAVAMKEEQTRNKDDRPPNHKTDIPYNTSYDRENMKNYQDMPKSHEDFSETKFKKPEILTKEESVDNSKYTLSPPQVSLDSETSEHKWQHMSFDEDYTASTVSSDGEYTDEGSFDGELDRRSQYSNEEETYNPRDKMARPSPLKDFIEEEEEDVSENEPLKPLPLPDPNFVPKPILKRREPELLEIKPVSPPALPKVEEKSKSKEKPKISEKIKIGKPAMTEKSNATEKLKATEKPKKEEKLTIFKKITNTKFPKLLHKKETEKAPEENVPNDNLKTNNKMDKTLDKVSEEGRTVIDYYGSIVKEYGSQKKSTAPMYLKTEDLKAVAEKQQLETKPENIEENQITTPKKVVNKTSNNTATPKKGKSANSINKSVKTKQSNNSVKNIPDKKIKTASPTPPENQNNTQKKGTQVVLRKAERATIVIPINYQELEEKAKVTVRSAIDYTVDVCLLLLAFWVYFFKDERLAIPFLILIIYRQLQETLLLNIPEWYKRYTPSWLKKKTS
uniref:Titin n=1 Tax=Heliothis virescens TaxID=7102 RepID=A0A2A4JSY3_HELVI